MNTILNHTWWWNNRNQTSWTNAIRII